MSSEEVDKSCPIEGEHRKALIETINIAGFSDLHRTRSAGSDSKVPINYKGQKTIGLKITDFDILIKEGCGLGSVLSSIEKVRGSFPDQFPSYCENMLVRLKNLPESIETIIMSVIYKAYIENRDIRKFLSDEGIQDSLPSDDVYSSWYIKFFFAGNVTKPLSYKSKAHPNFEDAATRFIQSIKEDSVDIFEGESKNLLGEYQDSYLDKISSEDLFWGFKCAAEQKFRDIGSKYKGEWLKGFIERLENHLSKFLVENEFEDQSIGEFLGAYCKDVILFFTDIVESKSKKLDQGEVYRPYKSLALFQALVPLYKKLCEDLQLEELTEANIPYAMERIPPLDESIVAEIARVKLEDQAAQRAFDIFEKIQAGHLRAEQLKEIINSLHAVTGQLDSFSESDTRKRKFEEYIEGDESQEIDRNTKLFRPDTELSGDYNFINGAE